ncbi:heat-inducible transcriptional repressor HrcA [Myxosarcina sp. GI1]|uniref:heat-inducible transcriptional repressor HrcA n=1 Tax=Myxosarcina sp. GI1 TaxID=1541065 RepID=UPI000566B9AF|nr:heat-inducible transcriptional repressor HrcA [Myxosarcina sp. GI1]
MAHLPDLSTRYQNILKATVKHYIATAEPVGSKTLAEEYDLNVSSATIRNAMGRLENAGLLYQPHVSAGRIPSDSGYRIYVDRLLVRDENIGKIIAQFLQHELQSEKGSFEALLQRATKILAALSGYIALITFPQKLNTTLHHLQLVRVASGQIMLIVVTDSYHTQSLLIESPFKNEAAIDEEAIAGELQILSNFLNQQLKGQSLDKIITIDWQEIDRQFACYTGFLKKLAATIQHSLQPSTFNPIAIHGVAEILRQPEFSQLDQVQTLLYLLEEEQEQLLPVIFSISDLERQLQKVKIVIGAENPLEPMQICTLVSANYYQDNIPIGSVGVIGPTRMLYENAIALVESTADYLSDTFK